MKIDYYADYIFYNGTVITVNKDDEICTALATKEDKIIYVGNDEGVEDLKGPDTEIIDLAGRALLPGFIDSHVHIYSRCLGEGGILVDVSSNVAGSIEEIKDILKKTVAVRGKGEGISLRGYDQNKLKEGRHITRADLDEAAPDNPVVAFRVCGHIGVLNSKALELAGIDENTKFENPEEIGFDENGRLNGMVMDSSMGKIMEGITFSAETYYKTFKPISDYLLSLGVTGIHEMGGAEINCLQAMQQSVEDGIFKPRVYLTYSNISTKKSTQIVADSQINYSARSRLGNGHFKIGPVKFMLDGSSSAPSSYTKEPYSHDPELKGIQTWKDQEELNEYVLKAHKAGFNVTAHALGDAAVDQLVTAYENAIREHPEDDARFRIEHCGITTPELIERIKKLNVVVISNPNFVTINGSDYNRFYGDRTKMMFASKSYQENGIIEGFGSDYPVTDISPLRGIFGAVTRKDIVNNELCGENQKISVMQAIRCHTYNNAYASFDEKTLGSLEPGKKADLVILSEDILKCDPERIIDIEVDNTMVDGVMEYSAK